MSTKLTKVIANFETQLTAKLSAGITTLNGTSTGTNTTNTINDTTKSWTVNQYAGYKITILSGTGAGQTFYITSNTATQITITGNWSVIPDATSVYQLKVSSATLLSATDKDGVALPAGRYCFALDLGNSLEEHIIADLNGTTLKNIESVSRQGVKTDGASKEHRVGCKVKLTDFVNLKILVDLLSGADNLDSTTPLAYDAEPTLNDRKQLATVGLVQDVVTGAVGTATPTNSGTIKSTHNQGTKPRAMSTLVREQNTPDLTLLVGAFKHAELDKNISFAGGNSPQFINPGFAGDLSITLNPGNTETFTLVINGTTCTFNFVTSIGATPGNILIGASAAATRANLAAFINNPGATSATQVAFTGAQLTALGYVTAIDDLSLNIFIKATSASLTSMSGAETMAGAGNIWTANTTKNRIDLLVLETTGNTLQIRRGTEALSPVAITPTSGDIVLAQVFCKTGMTAVKDVDDTINGYIANWYFPQVFRLDVAISKVLPVYETLTVGNILKALNDGGTTKAAKTIGQKSPITQSVTKAGTILKAKWLSPTKIVILTSTKLYLATFDGVTLGALVDITPASGSQDFDILDSTHIISGRAAFVTPNEIVYAIAIDVSSGSAAFGGEVSTTLASYSSGSITLLGVVATSPTAFAIAGHGGFSSGFYGMSVCCGTVSGTSLTIGSGVTLDSVNSSFTLPARKLKKIDATHFGYMCLANGNARFSMVKLNGTVTTVNNYTVQSSVGSSGGTWEFGVYNNIIYPIFTVLAGTTYKAAGTVSGDTVSFGAAVALGTNYTLSSVKTFNDIMYVVANQTIYRYALTNIIESQVIEQDTIATLSIVTEEASSSGKFYAMSDDTAIKTVEFLLDRTDVIGTADKSYAVNDNYAITNIWSGFSGLSQGLTYYIGVDGQTVSVTNTYKRLGRAISNSIIIKE